MVMEVLTAYVRQNAARSPEEATPIPSEDAPSLPSKGSEAKEDAEGTDSLEREVPASTLKNWRRNKRNWKRNYS
jgi:hypothetical protein